MSDLKVTKAILNKIKQYGKNEEVKRVLNELYDELFNDYHGLSVEDLCKEKFYDISVRTKDLTDHQKVFIATLLRKKMSYTDAYNKMNKNDEILVIEIIDFNSLIMYKDLLESKKIQYEVIKL